MTGMILIDLQKAFDTINHGTLLKKLYAIGFSKHWFWSYLINRKFLVNLGNVFSQLACVSSGVLQGSILGPLLFLMYIKNTSQAVKCNLSLYADDACLVCQHNDINETEKELNKDFESICDWFVNNKLSIHFGKGKTKSILFGTKFKIKKVIKLNVKYGDIQIKQHSKIKYLGCMLSGEITTFWLHLFSLVSQLNQKIEKQNPDFSEQIHTFLPTVR